MGLNEMANPLADKEEDRVLHVNVIIGKATTVRCARQKYNRICVAILETL